MGRYGAGRVAALIKNMKNFVEGLLKVHLFNY
jgi:hypothetical protein